MREFHDVQAVQMNMALGLMQQGNIEGATDILHMVVDNTSRLEKLFQEGKIPLESEEVTGIRRQHFLTQEEHFQKLEAAKPHVDDEVWTQLAKTLINPYIAEGGDDNPIVKALRKEKDTMYTTMASAVKTVGVSISEVAKFTEMKESQVRYLGDKLLNFDERGENTHRRYNLDQIAKLVIASKLREAGIQTSKIKSFLSIPGQSQENTIRK